MVLGCDRDHSIENEEEIEISSDSSDSNYVTNKWETINKSLNQYTKAVSYTHLTLPTTPYV